MRGRWIHWALCSACRLGSCSITALSAGALGVVAGSAHAQFSVTTQHYDNNRTGWNSQEAVLNYSTVAGKGAQPFGLQQQIVLDEQVDAQPFVLPNVVITGDPNPGTHDVVFVATQNNTIYAIDPTRGTILNSRNLGAPVPLPLGCTTNSQVVGITGTPVIDLSLNIKSIFVIAYVQGSTGPAYFIHRLALADFSDVVPPTQISASHKLTNGVTMNFTANAQRQHTGLLDFGTGFGTAVFAGFSSFCDNPDSGLSRGWLLAWNNYNLAPYPINNQPGAVLAELTDQLATSPNTFFLSSIWMSGFGPSAINGSVYFSTGNSDPKGTTYSGINNIAESVVKFSPQTNKVVSLFTPSTVASLDQTDQDVSAGAVVLLPTSVPGLPPGLAVATAKSGYMYLLNRGSLGGYVKGGPDRVLAEVGIGPCWCGPSYYDDASANLPGSGPKIVSSGGTTPTVWSLVPSGLQQGATASIASGQDGGFVTTVSSSGAAQPIIWAVSRPQSANPATVSLYAFQAQPPTGTLTMPTLFSGQAGTWPNTNADANITPVVANGHVYVASYKQLRVFGLGNLILPQNIAPGLPPPGSPPNQVSGVLLSISGTTLNLQTRSGSTVAVQASSPVQAAAVALVRLGQPLLVRGALDGMGTLQAEVINRLKPQSALWPADHL